MKMLDILRQELPEHKFAARVSLQVDGGSSPVSWDVEDEENIFRTTGDEGIITLYECALDQIKFYLRRLEHPDVFLSSLSVRGLQFYMVELDDQNRQMICNKILSWAEYQAMRAWAAQLGGDALEYKVTGVYKDPDGKEHIVYGLWPCRWPPSFTPESQSSVIFSFDCMKER
jgi:hypothetical protein